MLRRSTRLSARVQALAADRVSLALLAVFLFVAAFYLWRATYAEPLALHGGGESQYNQLADAFLHFHLWLVHVPEAALGPGNPYNPAERSAFLSGFPDYSLYGHYLYIEWGPVPVLVWLVPLHLLGFEPSASAISMPFAVVGLGFALATLRVILRQIGNVSLWMCVLAALTLAFASTVPFIVRFPLVYHEEIAAAYGFAMPAVWLTVTAICERRASLKRLVLLSLCIGLATGSRPTLAFLALLLVPVYMCLRTTHPRRGLALALAAPFGVCLALLLAYNQARFGSPLEYGANYQINGPSTYNAHFGELGYLAPGFWSYLLAPPRLSVIFPFLLIVYPQISYPFGLPAHYAPLSEETGGLLPMVPVLLFVLALPWIWRRRPALLGGLAPVLLVMACVGVACMTFVSYEIYITTERYETDYLTLFLFGALAVWLALGSTLEGRGRRLVRLGGALLAVWSCAAGLAISFLEIDRHLGTWRTLVNLSSPVSTAIANVAGHPVLAEVHGPDIQRKISNYANLGTDVTSFALSVNGEAEITIVSPDARQSALLADTAAGPALSGAALQVRLDGPGPARRTLELAAGSRRARIPIHLDRGVNQFVLVPAAASEPQVDPTVPEPESQLLMAFSNLAVAGG
jgi:hypothetical protein